MTISQSDAAAAATILKLGAPHTTVPRKGDRVRGLLFVIYQSDRVAYVRAGLTQDRDLPELARQPIECRGGTFSIRAHFYLDRVVDHRGSTQDGWTSGQPFVHRLDRPDLEPTASMMRDVLAAIRNALAEHADSDEGLQMRAHAQAIERFTEAREMRATAEQLAAVARELHANAAALENGGRVEYRRLTLTSGADKRVKQVRTGGGDLIDPVHEPPKVYGSFRYRDMSIVRDNQPEQE